MATSGPAGAGVSSLEPAGKDGQAGSSREALVRKGATLGEGLWESTKGAPGTQVLVYTQLPAGSRLVGSAWAGAQGAVSRGSHRAGVR